MEDAVTLSLSKNQAIVLFEWLTNLDDKDDPNYSHPSEERVVWELQSQLEKILTEPFDAEYPALLSAARTEVALGPKA